MKNKDLNLEHYTIFIDPSLQRLDDLITKKKYTSIFVLVDENTKKHCLPKLPVKAFQLIEISSGESFKNLQTCGEIWDFLLKNGADRKSLFINLGGGVIGDMGGFAASCFKRGMDFINIPTTLLSQVDASIGGKLAIDFKFAKNLIGLFKDPTAVFISTGFFETLPANQFKNGWAEIFKHALIYNANLWEEIKSLENLKIDDIERIVIRNLEIKKAVVEIDPFEKNLRKILNFGHTIGHAIESLSVENDKEPLLHGEAIIIGMICESFLSSKLLNMPQSELLDICTTLKKHFTEYDLSKISLDEVWDIMMYDKKNEDGKILCVLLEKIGKPIWDIPLQKADVESAFKYYIDLYEK
jgi:3-dehydroquinate synthase